MYLVIDDLLNSTSICNLQTAVSSHMRNACVPSGISCSIGNSIFSRFFPMLPIMYVLKMSKYLKASSSRIEPKASLLPSFIFFLAIYIASADAGDGTVFHRFSSDLFVDSTALPSVSSGLRAAESLRISFFSRSFLSPVQTYPCIWRFWYQEEKSPLFCTSISERLNAST